RDRLFESGLDVSRVAFGVDAYRVVYATVDPAGGPAVASGLIALPRHRETDLRMVAWLHGTTVYKWDAASVSEDSEDRSAAIFFAAAGYLASAPDYLGLGLSAGTHPYDDLASETSASLDLLRATLAFAQHEQRRVASDVAISGFSQGGPASLA